jgi:RNA polymerase sigma-70 factor (ECF subfamily)
LLRRVQQNDALAWHDFVNLYGPLIFAWTRRGELSPSDAADVTQEVLLSIHRAIDKFDHADGRGTLRGWIWTILRNKINDLHRHRPPAAGVGGTNMLRELQLLPEQLPDETSDAHENQQVGGLFQRAVAAIQAEFEPRTWQAFWLAVVEGQSTDEIAARLGMSANNVRQARSRVLRRLRDQLGEFS